MAKGGESFLMNFETVQLQTSVTVNVMFSQRRTFTVIVDFLQRDTCKLLSNQPRRCRRRSIFAKTKTFSAGELRRALVCHKLKLGKIQPISLRYSIFQVVKYDNITKCSRPICYGILSVSMSITVIDCVKLVVIENFSSLVAAPLSS